MKGNHSGSNSERVQSAYDQLTPPIRQRLIKKIAATSVGDLVESKFVIYGPAFTMDGYEASYGSGPSGSSQGIGTSSPKIYADMLDEIYGGQSVSIEKGKLGIVIDISLFNVHVHWLPKGPKWWIFPEEYDIVSKNKEDTARITGSY
jgi:hypothetical protein